ncbi:hypothetical protein [Methanoplanus endosymbiosus]|uniref:Uncharacterized protein n=1 Tax=Methanoplanus endosymbiosus TaxID=33865 RepID=A0A9E7PNJ3_9EURY|nr:hypothetical protein [Methanoplanus endosymbiosus]UUX93558.1 hypothetical protein L6E24_05430 [Methanoplanus endosymbiosus]
MSQTFYLLAERAKNYSSSERKCQYSKIKTETKKENKHNYPSPNQRNFGDNRRGEGIIIYA